MRPPRPVPELHIEHAVLTTHGSNLYDAINFHGEMGIIEPMRSIEPFVSAFQVAMMTALRGYRLLVEHYRQGETDALAKTYRDKWQRRLTHVPQIKIETDSLVIPVGG